MKKILDWSYLLYRGADSFNRCEVRKTRPTKTSMLHSFNPSPLVPIEFPFEWEWRPATNP